LFSPALSRYVGAHAFLLGDFIVVWWLVDRNSLYEGEPRSV